MAGSLTVRQARLVLPDRVVTGDLVVEDGIITEIAPRVERSCGLQIDGRSCALLPGLVDTHVHLDACEDLESVSRGAVAGGVTTVLGPRSAQTRAELKAELAQAATQSRVHYGLYIRATADNLDEVLAAERARAIYVSGALLASGQVERLFADTDRPLAVDNVLPDRHGPREAAQDVDPSEHPQIHDVADAVSATQQALDLARKHGAPTHLLHVSTAEEVALLQSRPEALTSAARLPHLFLDETAYEVLGTRAIAQPPIRGGRHREALWAGLAAGTVDVVASGHLPLKPETKDRPYPATHPGLPGIEWMLPLLLDRVRAGHLTLADLVRIVCERPAASLRLPRKGRLETGYDGDLVLVDLDLKRTIAPAPSPPADADALAAPIQSVSGWSPWSGTTLQGWPIMTVLLGEVVYRDGEHIETPRGRGL